MQVNKLRFGYYTALYAKALDKYPLPTKSITAGIIAGFSDIVSQLVLYKKAQYTEHDNNIKREPFVWNRSRSVRLALLGSFFVAPTSHFWYDYLATFGQSNIQVMKRVLLDQLFFTPATNVCFLAVLWTSAEGLSYNDVLHRLRITLPETIQDDWMYLLPTQTVNFKFVPTPYQVLFSDVVEAIWTIQMSFKSKRVEAEENDQI